MRTALDDYQFTNAAREIATLVDEVSNWYVRRSRNRFWESGMNAGGAYETLHEVLVTISKLIAPFTVCRGRHSSKFRRKQTFI